MTCSVIAGVAPLVTVAYDLPVDCDYDNTMDNLPTCEEDVEDEEYANTENEDSPQEEECVDADDTNPANYTQQNIELYNIQASSFEQLEALHSAALDILNNTVVATFPRSVYRGSFFVTAPQMDAFLAAMAPAEAVLSGDIGINEATAVSDLAAAILAITAAQIPGENHGMRSNFDGFDFVAEMGVGWNLGNALEAGGFPYGSERNLAGQCETTWGSPIITESMIDYVITAGFNTIRIPITWQNHIGPGPDYRITDHRMNRVEEIVNWVLERDAIAMINMHHDTWKNLSNVTGSGSGDVQPWTPQEAAAIEAQIVAVWTQIAERFAGYDDRLIFNALNEPREYGAFNQWIGGSAQAREVLNQRNQLIVNTIRETGGNNAYRFISVPTYAAGTNPTSMQGFRRPNDPTDPNYEMRRIILQVHSYEPGGLSLGENNWTDARRNSIEHIFAGPNRVRATAVREGRPGATYDNFATHAMPVIMGEFAWINNNNPISRAIHAQYYVYFFAQHGIATIWWDGLNKSPNTHESTGLLVRDAANPHWAFPNIVDAMMRGIAGESGLNHGSGLYIDPAERTLRIGITSSFTLRPYVLPLSGSQAISSWVSSDTAVATVNESGVVTAQGPGVATITGTATSGGHQASVTVTVRPDTTTRYNRMFDFETDGLEGIGMGDNDSITLDTSVARLGDGWDSNVLRLHNLEPASTDNINSVRDNGHFGWSNVSIRIPAENAPLIRRSNYVSFDFLIRVSDVTSSFNYMGIVLQTGTSFPGDQGWMGWWDERSNNLGTGFETITIDGEGFLWGTKQYFIGNHIQFMGTSTAINFGFRMQNFYYGAEIFIDNLTFTTGRTIPTSPEIPATDVVVTGVAISPDSARTHIVDGVMFIAEDATFLLPTQMTPEDATNQYTYFWQSSHARVGANRLTGEITGVTASNTVTNITTRSANSSIASPALPVIVSRGVTDLVHPMDTAVVIANDSITLPTPDITFVAGGGDVTEVDAVFWTSSDETIATVDENGVVTGVRGGTVTITVTSRVDWRRYDTIVVTVYAAPTITGPTSMILTEGYAATHTAPFAIDGNPTPAVSINNTHGGLITWDSGSNRLSIAAGLRPGSYVVTITVSNGIHQDATLVFTLGVSTLPATPPPPEVPLPPTVTPGADPAQLLPLIPRVTQLEQEDDAQETYQETYYEAYSYDEYYKDDENLEDVTELLHRVVRFVMENLVYTIDGISHDNDVAPFVDTAFNRVMIPLRAVSEALGAEVEWLPETRTVEIVTATGIQVLVIDVPLPNGMGTPVIIQNRVFVPLRFVAEFLGAEVEWDGENRAAYVFVTLS